MKRTLAVCVLPLLGLASMPSQADNGPGCGLGQQIFAGQSGLAPHVLAATTNGSTYNQLFGLTFDSLGCNGESVITAEFQRNVFVANHYDNIAHDAARGGGEHLESLARLMSMPDQDTERFVALARDHYDELFDVEHADAGVWLAKLDRTLAADPALARYVDTQLGS